MGTREQGAQERWITGAAPAVAAAAALNPDGDAFSFYSYSRLDVGLPQGGRFDCEDLRDGCPGMVPEAGDGYKGDYSYVKIDTSPDAARGAGRGAQSTVSTALPATRRSSSAWIAAAASVHDTVTSICGSRRPSATKSARRRRSAAAERVRSSSSKM